jgi:hypothetical protein
MNPVLRTGLLLGLLGVVLGAWVVIDAGSNKTLFAGACVLAGGAVFLGYSLFAAIYARTRRR